MKILPEVTQVAFHLSRPGFSLAFLVSKQICYYAYFPRTVLAPSSAVVKLLQGLFDQHKDLSFFLLRNRIWTTEPVSLMEKSMVKVVAKRISQIAACDQGLELALQFCEIGNAEQIFYPMVLTAKPQRPHSLAKESEIWRYLHAQAKSNPRGPILHDFHRDVAAVLVDQKGNVLATGLNSSAINKTLHAEVNLIQSYYQNSGGPLPQDAILYVTHKPCKMCAGMIVDACRGTPIEVRFQIEESGCFSRFTALDAPSSAKISQPNFSSLDSPTP